MYSACIATFRRKAIIIALETRDVLKLTDIFWRACLQNYKTREREHVIVQNFIIGQSPSSRMRFT